jgi:hypothetical protein
MELTPGDKSVAYPKTRQVPEFIDPVFAKTSPNRSFSVIENERFGLVFAKSGSLNSGKVEGQIKDKAWSKDRIGIRRQARSV